MTVKKIALVLYCALLMGHQASAETVPYDKIGIISAIHLSKNIIVIDNTDFEIASYAEVYRNRKSHPQHVYGLRDLAPGMLVGLKTEAIMDLPHIVNEVWLLDSSIPIPTTIKE